MNPNYTLYTTVALNNQTSNLSFLVFRFLTFFVIFFIILAAAYYTTRYISNKSITFMNHKNLKIVERISLGLDKSMYMISVDSQYYLIACSKNSIDLIDKFDKKDISINHTITDSEHKEGFHSILSSYFQKNSSKDLNISEEPSKFNLKSKLMEIKKRSLEIEKSNKEGEPNKDEKIWIEIAS